MMIELQAHYLDLIVHLLSQAGHACLLRSVNEHRGAIFVTESETSTRSVAVLAFDFGQTHVHFGIEFRDGRGALSHSVSYHDGLDPFFAVLKRALLGNRIENKRAA